MGPVGDFSEKMVAAHAPNKDLPRLACLQLLLQQRGRRHLVGKSKMNLKITGLKRKIIFQTYFTGVTILGPSFLSWGRTIPKEGQRFAFNWILIKFRVSLHFQPLNKCLGKIPQNSLGWSMLLTPMVIFLPRPRKNWAPYILSWNKNRKPTKVTPKWGENGRFLRNASYFSARQVVFTASSQKAWQTFWRDKRYQC